MPRMPRLNKVSLIGHLSADPEIKSLQNGRIVLTAHIATDESYSNKDGDRVEQTGWHHIVVWSPRVIKSIKKLMASSGSLKGGLIFCQGKLRTRSYEKDGDTRNITEIIVSENEGFQLLGRRTRNATSSASKDKAKADQ